MTTTFYNVALGAGNSISPPDSLGNLTQAQIAAMCSAASWRPYFWRPNNAGTTVATAQGVVLGNTLGTVTHPALADTAYRTSIPSMVLTAAVGDNYASIFTGTGTTGTGFCLRGSSAGVGGVYSAWLGSLDTDAGTTSMFTGLGATVGGGTATPQTRDNHIGLSYETTDSTGTQFFLSRRTTSGTNRLQLAAGQSYTGLAGTAVVQNSLTRAASGPVWMLEVYIPPGVLSGARGISVRVTILTNADTAVPVFNGVFTDNLPAANTPLVLEHYTRGVGTPAMRYFGWWGWIGGGVAIP